MAIVTVTIKSRYHLFFIPCTCSKWVLRILVSLVWDTNYKRKQVVLFNLGSFQSSLDYCLALALIFKLTLNPMPLSHHSFLVSSSTSSHTLLPTLWMSRVSYKFRNITQQSKGLPKSSCWHCRVVCKKLQDVIILLRFHDPPNWRYVLTTLMSPSPTYDTSL